MKDAVKEALRAERAMNEALKEGKIKKKKHQSIPKTTVVAPSI